MQAPSSLQPRPRPAAAAAAWPRARSRPVLPRPIRPVCATVGREQPRCDRGRVRRCSPHGSFDKNKPGQDHACPTPSPMTNPLAPPGATPTPRRPAAPAGRFRHAGRSARLCRDRRARHEFPRCARHADLAPIPMPSCATPRSTTPAASSRLASPRATASRWSPKPAPNSPPASSARSMPACGPCPLPLPTSFGGRDAYVDQLLGHARQLRPHAVPLSARTRRFLPPPPPTAASVEGDELGRARRRASTPTPRCQTVEPDDIGYLQYCSGSTRFPHGVAVTHRALLDNLRAHASASRSRTPTAASAGCPGITTWAWSAACCRRSRTRSASII